jgi:uncharacterized protein YbaR (Trm112 family)
MRWLVSHAVATTGSKMRWRPNPPHAIRGAELISEGEREDRARRVEGLCACPSCHWHLIWSADSVHCATCAATYERRDGIPILIPADMDFLPTKTRWIPPPALTFHPRLNAFVDARSRVSIPLNVQIKAITRDCTTFRRLILVG